DYGLWLAMIGAGYRLANLEAPLVRARLGEGFHRRRSGLNHLASEWAIFRLKRRLAGLGGPAATAALVARSTALAFPLTARLAYQGLLRR
ncbi:MAG: hypothetical protein ACR2FH_09525, partial [Caulobacteraceae bacterium]